jgi:hypothetical protein
MLKCNLMKNENKKGDIERRETERRVRDSNLKRSKQKVER